MITLSWISAAALLGPMLGDAALEDALLRAREPEQSAAAIAAIAGNPGALPWAFDALAEDEIEGFGALAPVDRETLRAVIGIVEHGRLVRFVEASTPGWDRRARTTALGLLGDLADADELDLLLGCGAESAVTAGSRRAFQGALSTFFDRHPRSCSGLIVSWDRVPAELRTSALRAAGTVDHPAAMDVLTYVLASEPELESVALVEIGRLGSKRPLEDGPRICDHVRPFLRRDESELVRAASQTLGHLRDPHSVPRLIGLLESDDGAIRRSAHWALEAITGVEKAPSARTWGEWFRRENAWFRSRGAEVVEALDSGSRAAVVAAIHELVQHRLFREDLGVALAEVVVRDDGGVSALASKAIQQLGARTGLDALVEALEHRDEAAREAALVALRSITGEDLPPTSADWRRALAPRR